MSSRKSKKILSEMFVSEATLEFPDGEIDAMNRVLAGAARRGAIPRDALENWPILKGFAPRHPKKDASGSDGRAKPSVKPSTPMGAGPASSASASTPGKSGRVIPATNRFRQDQGHSTSSHRPGDSVGSKPTTGTDRPSGPGILKRAVSAVRGVDPETGFKKQKSAAFKVHGGDGPARLPNLDRFFPSGDASSKPGGPPDDESDPLSAYPNKEPVPAPDFQDDEKTDPDYVSPFSHLGISGGDDDDRDPKVSAVKKAFSKARPHADRTPKDSPEADAWARFGGQGDDDKPDVKKAKKQGKLSRFFKGQRDDDI